MLRILHVNDYPPGSGGGAEVLMARTVAVSESAGWDCRIFSRDDLPDPRRTPLRYLSNRQADGVLLEVLNDFRPDVVHLHNFYHVLSPLILQTLRRYRRIRPLRVVMTAHDFHLICPNSGANWFDCGPKVADLASLGSLRYLLTRRWDHRGFGHSFLKLIQHLRHYRMRDRRKVIDAVIAPSRFLRDALRRYGLPAQFVPNPTPAVQPVTGGRPSSLTYVFAGRIEPEKGLRKWLEMIEVLGDARIDVIGEGADQAACEALVAARSWRNQVRFRGRLPHADAMQAIGSAHVLVLPSRWYENYPLCLIEALALGTNILVADLGGMAEIVGDSGTGYKFRPDDPVSLAEAMMRIGTDFATGGLNRFDARPFLESRGEAPYLAELRGIYFGGSGG